MLGEGGWGGRLPRGAEFTVARGDHLLRSSFIKPKQYRMIDRNGVLVIYKDKVVFSFFMSICNSLTSFSQNLIEELGRTTGILFD